MSSKKTKSPYGYYGVYGSLAYDFRPIGNERAGEYSGHAATQQKKKIKRRAGGKSPALFVSVLLCIIMLLCGLLSRNYIVILSDEADALQEEISHLTQEQVQLKIEHAMAFSPEETERYATEKLGMKKPGAEQIYYIEIESEEASAEEKDENSKGGLLSIIRAYLPG